MDDSQKIDRLIEVMQELHILVEQLDKRNIDTDMIIGMMIALIITTPVPNVTILSNSREEVAYA
tara:strand:- start:182 stop:373 length:192 start_codon:yes stop_codon:yes gene_type:complete